MYIDSHCHLDLIVEQDNTLSIDRIISEAKEQNVKTLLTICVNLAGFEKVKLIANKHKDVYCSFGIHPNEAGDVIFDYEVLKEKANSDLKIIAIGETGLDYYRTTDINAIKIQQENFINHIKLSKELNKPLIIHTREAAKDTLDILTKYKPAGIIHCFTEDWEFAQHVLGLGFYISFSGIVTFKNAKQIQEVAQKMPLEKMLIETDSPYLAPSPYRGKINYPKHVIEVAKYIAKLRNITVEEIANATTANFNSLFGFE